LNFLILNFKNLDEEAPGAVGDSYLVRAALKIERFKDNESHHVR